MAELALAITGVALAWKGILDFGQLMSKLMDDDTRQRDILAIKLESSQHMLKDWGGHWGVDRNTGRFHTFEASRKELIMEIIFRLRDSRYNAVKRLKEKYGIFTDEEEKQGEDSGKRLSKMVERVVGAAKRGKVKSRWLMHDRALVTELVEETMELHTCLNSLTSLSINFLVAHFTTPRDAQPLESGLAHSESQVKEQVQNRSRAASQLHNLPTQNLIDGLAEQTLAGYASKSITSSRQTERVQKHIDCSLHYHGDTRVPETVAIWWNDARAGILVLEVPDDAEDRTSTSACVLLYYLVDCHKLIFIFESESEKGPAQQLLDMLRALIQSLVSLRGNQPLNGISLPVNITETENETVDAARMSQLIGLFHNLLRGVLDSCDRRILLIIDGLELSGLSEENSLGHLVRSFVLGLQTVCNMNDYGPKAIFKALLGYKGHATMLYDCVEVTNIVDVTDCATRVTCMKEELALALHD